MDDKKTDKMLLSMFIEFLKQVHSCGYAKGYLEGVQDATGDRGAWCDAAAKTKRVNNDDRHRKRLD